MAKWLASYSASLCSARGCLLTSQTCSGAFCWWTISVSVHPGYVYFERNENVADRTWTKWYGVGMSVSIDEWALPFLYWYWQDMEGLIMNVLSDLMVVGGIYGCWETGHFQAHKHARSCQFVAIACLFPATAMLIPCLFHAYSVPQPCYSNATCSIPGPRVGSICQVIQPVQRLWIGTWESRTSLLSRHVMVGLTRDKRWFCPLTIREYNELRG